MKVVKKLHATFDGKVFLPRELIDIKPNTDWVMLISDEKEEASVNEEQHSWEAITRLSADIGPVSADIAIQESFGRLEKNFLEKYMGAPAGLSENKEEHLLEAITRLSIDMGPADLSENFDHYTHSLRDGW
jgi:hypothetical protein